ncbi:MAG TPA: sigma-70 family RNA polymerase sigma factor [Candidatus Saccharimonadaceae bacterium]|jgi:RNA polymerase sigma-70 factor, ECF subfamily|nr:sigma-70 family RNA polymerase sigma factor [Candidatus Saccharimonadaceae bacterium]
MAPQPGDAPPHSGPGPLESTAVLFERMRGGDEAARQRLFERFLPILRRWAHGRIPARARGMADTDDIVQVTLIRALNRLDAFEPRREGAFLAYLRHILLNSVREELRRAGRKPSASGQEFERADPAPSPLEQAIGADELARYEQALGDLPVESREAVLMRIEFGYSYAEIAEALGKPNPNAVRMTISRALVKLAERMRE